MRWLITNRNQDKADGFGSNFAALTYWTFDPAVNPGKDLRLRSTWTKSNEKDFQAALKVAAHRFPDPALTDIEDQKHVCLFVHGYNTGWTHAMETYNAIATTLFDGAQGLGELISFDWPSKGSLLGYLPDRSEARQSGDDLITVLSNLYDWMLFKQAAGNRNQEDGCRARTSIIAHSMGNYALEYAMNEVWTRKNRPLLASLILETIMVAADVDNDLFRNGENVAHGDGEGLANLSYRITALYTGRDGVLGASAGLKHFGKRRLGRAGLDRTHPVPDNIWDVDCTALFTQKVSGIAVHSEYFKPAETEIFHLIRGILEGHDRSVLLNEGLVPLAVARQQLVSVQGQPGLAPALQARYEI